MKFALHAVRLSALSLIAVRANDSGLQIHATDREGKALNDAMVYVEPDSRQVAKSTQRVNTEQKNLAFIPLMSVIQAGSRITFPNHDQVRHQSILSTAGY